MKTFLLILLAMIAVQLGGCGGSEEEATSEARTEVETAAGPKAWSRLKKVAGETSGDLLIPQGPPPEEVVVRQLRAGKGRALRKGDSFAVNYMDFDYQTGKLIENYWEQLSPPFVSVYDEGTTVRAWTPGLKGARPGELRELIVPSRWAYEDGARVYLVEVLEILD